MDRKKPGVNQFAEFRKTFQLSRVVRRAQAFISVDSDYELWVNGQFAGWNQYPNWPKEKSFNVHEMGRLLKKGKNCVAVRVRYRGEDFHTYTNSGVGKAGITPDNSAIMLLPQRFTNSKGRDSILPPFQSQNKTSTPPNPDPDLKFQLPRDA